MRKKHNSTQILIPIFCSLFFLSGCVPTYIFDDIMIIEGIGYDYIGNGKIIGTITTPNFVQGTGSGGSQSTGVPANGPMVRTLSAKTYDGKSLIDKFQAEGQMGLQGGKTRLMIYNKAMAKHGLLRQLSFRNRDPDVPRDMNLAVVEGNCREILTSNDYQAQMSVTQYIQNLIQDNSRQNYPETDLAKFLYAYYGAYMDPFMPLIRKQGDHLELRGLAIFKKDRYVMSIPNKKVFLFKMLFQKFNQGVYDMQYAHGKHIALRNVHTAISYYVRNGNSATPDIYAKVKVIGQVRQATPKAISKRTSQSVAKLFEKSLTYNAKALVHQFQKKGVDPLQLGDQVRSFTYHFDGASWPDRYPNAHFHCQVSVNIQQTGISN